uniref:Uncharacterized protein n=1 Tax=Anguilla anguilla TaxID=7936 RepID=A0A0E9SA24_ANGAN
MYSTSKEEPPLYLTKIHTFHGYVFDISICNAMLLHRCNSR